MFEARHDMLAHSKHSINISIYYCSHCHNISELGLTSIKRILGPKEGSELPEASR